MTGRFRRIYAWRLVFVILALFTGGCNYTLLKGKAQGRRLPPLPANKLYHPTYENFEGYDTLTFLFQNWAAINDGISDTLYHFQPLDGRSIPARGRREAFLCEPNGNCEWYSLKGAESSSLEFGTWKMYGTDQFTLVLYNEQDKYFGSYLILALSKTKLTLQKVPNPVPPVKEERPPIWVY